MLALNELNHCFPNTGSGPICGSRKHFYGSPDLLFPTFCFKLLLFQNIFKKAFPKKAKIFMDWKQNPMIFFSSTLINIKEKSTEVVKIADLQAHNATQIDFSLISNFAFNPWKSLLFLGTLFWKCFEIIII